MPGSSSAFNCPIYTYEFILDAAGVVLEDTEEGAPVEQLQPKGKPALSSYSIDALNKMLDEVLGKRTTSGSGDSGMRSAGADL